MTRIVLIVVAGWLAVSPVAAGSARSQTPASPTAASVPAGARLDIRLQTAIDSASAKADQKFQSATIAEYSRDGRVLIPVVSLVTGFVSSVHPSDLRDRNGRVTLSFDSVRVVDQPLRLRATVDQIFSGDHLVTDNSRLGADAVVGAAVGRVPGAGLTLMSGVTADPGGAIVSTNGADVHLPIGTVLRIRLDRDVQISGGPGLPGPYLK